MTEALRSWDGTRQFSTSGRRAIESWRERDSIEQPVRSGAESFIAGTASCRIRVEDVDGLHAELAAAHVLHPASSDGVTDTDYGARDFATLDLDGNLVIFFRWDFE